MGVNRKQSTNPPVNIHLLGMRRLFGRAYFSLLSAMCSPLCFYFAPPVEDVADLIINAGAHLDLDGIDFHHLAQHITQQRRLTQNGHILEQALRTQVVADLLAFPEVLIMGGHTLNVEKTFER
jgi:hypothetical protein